MSVYYETSLVQNNLLRQSIQCQALLTKLAAVKKDKGNGVLLLSIVLGGEDVSSLLFPLSLWRSHLLGDEEEVVFLAALGEDVLVVEEE